MDRMSAMQFFRRVVETGSFTAVASEMGLSQSTVSKNVAGLERYLKSKLLNRSTRQLHLTDAGQRYYERCCVILDEIADTELELQVQQSIPTGLLKVNIPIAAGRMKILPILWTFQERYPQLKVDMYLDDNYIDLVKDGVDVTIRIGELPDSSLIAKKLGTIPRYMVASPAYLKAHAEPTQLDDLLKHNCLIYSLLTTKNEWHFSHQGEQQKVSVKGHFSSNSPDAIREAALAGQGVAVMLGWLVEDDIKNNNLTLLMPEFVPTALDIHAVYPQRQFVPAKVSLFLDHLQAALNE